MERSSAATSKRCVNDTEFRQLKFRYRHRKLKAEVSSLLSYEFYCIFVYWLTYAHINLHGYAALSF